MWCDMCAYIVSVKLTPTRIPFSICSISYVTVTSSTPARAVTFVLSVNVPLTLPLSGDPEDCTTIPYGREQGRAVVVSSTGILKKATDTTNEHCVVRQSLDWLHCPETACWDKVLFTDSCPDAHMPLHVAAVHTCVVEHVRDLLSIEVVHTRTTHRSTLLVTVVHARV
jgi:hypothetical protein